MEPLFLSLIAAVTTLSVVSILCWSALRAWRDWIDVKRLELAPRAGPSPDEPGAGVLIEMAALKERLRRLEAIASGVEL